MVRELRRSARLASRSSQQPNNKLQSDAAATIAPNAAAKARPASRRGKPSAASASKIHPERRIARLKAVAAGEAAQRYRSKSSPLATRTATSGRRRATSVYDPHRPSPLLSLAPELRDMIYELCMVENETPIVTVEDVTWGKEIKYILSCRYPTNVLLLNRQIKAEAEARLFELATLYVVFQHLIGHSVLRRNDMPSTVRLKRHRPPALERALRVKNCHLLGPVHFSPLDQNLGHYTSLKFLPELRLAVLLREVMPNLRNMWVDTGYCSKYRRFLCPLWPCAIGGRRRRVDRDLSVFTRDIPELKRFTVEGPITDRSEILGAIFGAIL